MHPYRTPYEPSRAGVAEAVDLRLALGVLATVSLVQLCTAGDRWGAVLGFALVVASTIGLVTTARRS